MNGPLGVVQERERRRGVRENGLTRGKCPHRPAAWMSMDEFLFFNVHILKISSDLIIFKSSGESLILQITLN